MKQKCQEQTLTEKAVSAMKEAVRGVVEDHRRRNRPLTSWENGHVVYRDPTSGQTVHEDSVPYDTKREGNDLR
jgi:hypothetical protein